MVAFPCRAKAGTPGACRRLLMLPRGALITCYLSPRTCHPNHSVIFVLVVAAGARVRLFCLLSD
ncbi:hypothetical protein LJ737_02605 [Hymenobacter sp. 15J16-1T3B]|nr:hypothetical protein [Hymenobacter sp. 15J16-1T3B]